MPRRSSNHEFDHRRVPLVAVQTSIAAFDRDLSAFFGHPYSGSQNPIIIFIIFTAQHGLLRQACERQSCEVGGQQATKEVPAFRH